MLDKYFLDVAGTKKLIEKTVNAGEYCIYLDISGAGLPKWIDSSGNISNSAQHIHFYRGKNALTQGVSGNSNLVEMPTDSSAPNAIPVGFDIDHCVVIIHHGDSGVTVDDVLRPTTRYYNISGGRPIIFTSFGPNNITYSLTLYSNGQWNYSTSQNIDKVIAKVRITKDNLWHAIKEIPLNNAVTEDGYVYYTTPGNSEEYSLACPDYADLIFENWKKSELQLIIDGELWQSFVVNSSDPAVYNQNNDDLTGRNKTIILRPNMAGHFELLADDINPESILYTSEPFEMEDKVFIAQIGLEYDPAGKSWDHGYGPGSIDFCLLEAISSKDVFGMLEDD